MQILNLRPIPGIVELLPVFVKLLDVSSLFGGASHRKALQLPQRFGIAIATAIRIKNKIKK